jgi:hypothetical protein
MSGTVAQSQSPSPGPILVAATSAGLSRHDDRWSKNPRDLVSLEMLNQGDEYVHNHLRGSARHVTTKKFGEDRPEGPWNINNCLYIAI